MTKFDKEVENAKRRLKMLPKRRCNICGKTLAYSEALACHRKCYNK